MAKPPAGSSLLFGALADAGRIKQSKNGSYCMVLKGVDEIDWFTDRPFRSEGLWKPQKLISQWDSFFETSDPNAQASFKVEGERELITFEMFKPKYNKKNQKLSLKIDAEIINKRQGDIITGLKGKALDEVSLFIDNALEDSGLPPCFPYCVKAELRGIDLSSKLLNTNFVLADLSNANLSNSNLEGASLFQANLKDADLSRSNFYKARFDEADLRNANLSRASLIRADLISVDLAGANLQGADCRRASLVGAHLVGANLKNANLNEAQLYEANLKDADLTGASLQHVDLGKADLTNAILTGAQWLDTRCPNGYRNSGTSPCMGEQLNPDLYPW